MLSGRQLQGACRICFTSRMATVSQEQREHAAPWQTHTVFNQAPPLQDLDVYSSNLPLVAAVRRGRAEWTGGRAPALGSFVGGAPQQSWGRLANENKPGLRTHDRYGNRIDEVEFHPAWHQLMQMGIENELHSLPWTSEEPFSHTARAALYMTAMQAEAGFCCPVTMTFAVVPALRAQPELAAEWEPRLMARTYDPRLLAPGEKASAIAGMAMTEKQGGSDVRANTTVATPLNGGGAGGEYELSGHKWFCSAPMCDIFLVLAQTDEGLSCFLLPRILPDRSRNAFHIQRLKDKLGNHSNASSEIELPGAWAQMVGDPGRGVPTIIEMVGHTRLDCVIGSAAGMRSGVVSATHHTAYRQAFGKRLIEQPLMRNVLADPCLESEDTPAPAMRLARAYDEADADARAAENETDAQLFKRLATAVGKYWTCKRAPNHACEALECLGGNGYVEDSGMPRLYREAPLMGIWEGSGNVSALDTLRAMATRPECVEVLFDELAKSAGQDARLDGHIERLRSQLGDLDTIAYRARKVAEDICLALQGSLLVRHGHPAVAEAFLATRLGGQWGGAFGTMPAGLDFAPILEGAVVRAG